MDLSYRYDEPHQGEPILKGKTIASVEQGEFEIILTFDDGSVLKCSGSSWEGSSLGVEFAEFKALLGNVADQVRGFRG